MILNKCKIVVLLAFILIAVHIHAQNKIGDLDKKYFPINQIDEKGKQGIWFQFYKNDSTIINMFNYRNDTLDGPFIVYWENGNIADIGFYKNGLIDSIEIGFWEDGITKRGEVTFINGVGNGYATSYDRSGQITTHYRYINGEIDSTYSNTFVSKDFIPDARVPEAVPYTKIDTVTSYFYSKKWNKKIDIYINDTLNHEIFYKWNKLHIQNDYFNGIATKRVIYAEYNPKIIQRIYYYNNEKLYKTEYYNKNGKIIKKKISQ